MVMPILLALIAVGAASPSCPGQTTPEVDACLLDELDQADRMLNRYIAAAQTKLRFDSGDGAKNSSTGLVQAQKAWRAYRDAECGAVSDNWQPGTIATSFSIACEIRLTRLRTFAVWRNWLTYVDSTPPVLPEPPMDHALADRAP